MCNVSRDTILDYLSNQCQHLNITESLIFGNYSGTRLSFAGNEIMTGEFESYVFPIEEQISLYKKTMLNQNMSSPYFLNDKKIVLYNQSDSSSLVLIGNLSLWVESLIL